MRKLLHYAARAAISAALTSCAAAPAPTVGASAASVDPYCADPRRIWGQAVEVCLAACEHCPEGDLPGGLCPFDSADVWDCYPDCPVWCETACEDESLTVCPGVEVDCGAACGFERI